METKQRQRLSLLFTIFFSFFAHGAAIKSSDTSALLAFMSTADQKSSLSSSWISNDACQNWTGVTCNGNPDNRVIGLSLPYSNLSGSISPFIGNLTVLVSLNLSGNNLTGALPSAAFLHLRRLRYLDLSYNFFSSSIPEYLGSLPNLQILNMRDNSFSGLLHSFLFNSSTLKVLSLSNNLLSGALPENLSLPNLTDLSIYGNNLEGKIPPSVGELSSLKNLDLSSNLFSGKLPSQIGNLERLEYLGLDNNNFTGEIPTAMGNLTNLQELYFSNTQISGEIPYELGKLQNLKILFLGRNQLSGGFPSAIYNMSSLLRLDLGGNWLLSGQLPKDFGLRLPPALYELYINVNNFSGEIPPSVGNVSKLQVLELSYNSFHGGVPEELDLLDELIVFNVNMNSLSGSLSFLGALSRCKSLVYLNLKSNRFEGILPPAGISNFSSLEQFIVQDNLLEGDIPKSFSNLTAMTVIVLSYNRFSVAVPKELWQMPNIQRLYFEVNNLHGSLPPELGLARNLNLLYLQVNKISGPIVDSIRNLTKLQKLNMAENQFEGEIPAGLWKLSEVNELNLSHNKLQGSLSAAMKNLGKLTQFDLSANKLSGFIPKTIGEMLMLDYLSLAKNNISGEIPSSIGSIVSLRTLDLSFNSLSGNVPETLTNLRHLENLNLSFNDLEGRLPFKGLFSNASEGISAASFAGNPKLCGSPYFGLPADCPTAHKRRKHVYFISMVISFSLLLVFLIFLSFVVAWRTRRNKIKKKLMTEEENILDPGHPMITLRELETATRGFSQDNLLGSGSFGKVYKGILADGSPVAVKVLNEEMGEAAWKSFDAECKVLRSVRHRNLVNVITTCSNLDFRAIVLPFMPNGALQRWLHPEIHLSLVQVVRIADDVAAALEYLHHGCSTPVLHCDVKPSNVLLDEDMVARLGDFGIAKVALEQGTSATRSSARGTFGYMAPEYGMAARVTTKGDVYSYGILLLEMLTGVSPTDERFAGGEMNLRLWVAAALNGGAKDVVARRLLQEELGSVDHDCMTEMVELGLECSVEPRKDRPDMVEVAARMKKIRGTCEALTFN